MSKSCHSRKHQIFIFVLLTFALFHSRTLLVQYIVLVGLFSVNISSLHAHYRPRIPICCPHISTLCLLNSGCYLFTHYVVNMMICRVRLMFCGNVKWPLKTDGKNFTYFRVQLLVWSGIMSYLLLCCIVDRYCSPCFIYDIIRLMRCLY